jgi:hypothetical protein
MTHRFGNLRFNEKPISFRVLAEKIDAIDSLASA